MEPFFKQLNTLNSLICIPPLVFMSLSQSVFIAVSRSPTQSWVVSSVLFPQVLGVVQRSAPLWQLKTLDLLPLSDQRLMSPGERASGLSSTLPRENSGCQKSPTKAVRVKGREVDRELRDNLMICLNILIMSTDSVKSREGKRQNYNFVWEFFLDIYF